MINTIKFIIQIFYGIVLFNIVACTTGKVVQENQQDKEPVEEEEITNKEEFQTFQVPAGSQSITNFQPLIIQPNDILSIRISGNLIATAPFRLSDGNASAADEYLVNDQGVINFPIFGEVSLKELTIESAKSKLTDLLQPYFTQQPIVKVRLINFNISVNGAVKSPGVFPITNNRVTVIEAITMAGDFTNLAKRDSVLVIREQNGIREFNYLNFSNTSIFNSKYFYLQQNDVVHVPIDPVLINKLEEKDN